MKSPRIGGGDVLQMKRVLRASWPPPPHDPRERIVLCRAEDWQVRSFPLGDRRFEYFAARGFWHIQLWHPRTGVSLLTPSGLTMDRDELSPSGGWKLQAADHQEIDVLLALLHGLAPPSAGTLQALESFFVHDTVDAFLRARASETAAELVSVCSPMRSTART